MTTLKNTAILIPESLFAKKARIANKISWTKTPTIATKYGGFPVHSTKKLLHKPKANKIALEIS